MEENMMAMASKMPFFSKLAEEELRLLISGMKKAEFKAGAIIFGEGDTGDEMFVLIDGVVDFPIPAKAFAATDTGRDSSARRLPVPLEIELAIEIALLAAFAA